MGKVGFIGLGIMGKPMAINLLKAGYSVSVLEQSNASLELKEHGASVAKCIEELASDVSILITMLPDSPEVKSVVSKLTKCILKGSLFIDMSTISPSVAKDIFTTFEGIGVEALDAPVSGGEVGAVAASLSIMVGGNTSSFERALPIFQSMGKNIVHIGKAGAGQTTKACNQIIVGITIQAVAEAFALAKKEGVDQGKVREALMGGFAQSRILDLHGTRLIEENFKPGFKIKLHKKDMDIAMKAAVENGMTLLGTSLVSKLMSDAVNQGNGELDHSSLALLIN
jgi:2-hydroxy-3-oxopropionate reductase